MLIRFFPLKAVRFLLPWRPADQAWTTFKRVRSVSKYLKLCFLIFVSTFHNILCHILVRKKFKKVRGIFKNGFFIVLRWCWIGWQQPTSVCGWCKLKLCSDILCQLHRWQIQIQIQIQIQTSGWCKPHLCLDI